MKAAVCDDEQVILEEMVKTVEEIPLVEGCDGFKDPESLFRSIESGEKYQVILMDIEWQGKEAGITAAEQIRRLDPEARIIYMTGYTRQYVQQIFLRPSNLSGFLMKPVDPELLKQNIQKIALKNQEEKRGLLVKYKSSVRSIRFDAIFYLESAGHLITIHTEEGHQNCYDRLDKMMERLPESFLQCHKSYVVNMDKIQRIERNRIVMADSQEVPISKARYRETKSRYFPYMEGILFSGKEKE